jgi:hypothetical protein
VQVVLLISILLISESEVVPEIINDLLQMLFILCGSLTTSRSFLLAAANSTFTSSS